MNRRILILQFFFLIGVLFGSSEEVDAQTVKVSTRVENQEVYLGEDIIAQVIVTGAKADDAPEFEKVSGLQIEYQGMRDFSQSMTQDINGRVTRTVTYQFVYQYKVSIKKKAVSAIPKATVKVAGKNYSTAPVSMTVKIPAETDEYKLRLQASKNTVFVGEPVTITARWYLRRNIKGFEFFLPETQSYEIFPATDETLKKETLKAEILGEDTKIDRKSAVLDGTEFTVFEFQKVVVFNESGVQKFGPLTVQLKAIMGRRRSRDLFDLGSRDILKKFRIPSNSLQFKVKALAPAPVDFTGLIGRPELEVSAEARRVRVGDPIKVTVRGRCDAPLARLKLPNLQSQDIAQRFKISKPESSGSIEGGWKVQRWTIRAKDSKLKAIPKVTLSYFDPRSGQYKRAESSEISLEVEESRAVELGDLNKADGSSKSYELEPSDLGISHNIVQLSALENQHSDWRSLLFSRWTAFAALPLVCYLLLRIGLFFMTKPWLSPEKKRLRELLREAEQGLAALNSQSSKELAEGVGQILRTLIAKLAHFDVRSLSSDEAIQWLGQSEGNLNLLAPILQACDAAQFGGEDFALNQVQECREILTRVRSQL